MPPSSAPSILDALRQFGLLDAGQFDEIHHVAKSQAAESTALAQTLVTKGWLTPFQAEQLLQGRAADLILGQYLLLDRLGQGSMGEVYKARHQKLRRIVALKVIRADRLASRIAVERFRREVFAVSQLSHPNVVLAYDAYQVDNLLFYAMEYAEGIDLAKLVDGQGPLSVGPACDYIRQAALGLQHAFERGIIHRDIKPSNLLLTQVQGMHQIKLLDLGLSRLFLRKTKPIDATLTHAGSIVGTPAYMAPEQAHDSHTVDIRADIYSLGCTLYHLLAGKVPHAGTTAMDTFFKHQLEEARPIEALRGNLSASLAPIVRKLMAKTPDERFQTPGDVATALQPFARSVTGPLPTLGAIPVGNKLDAAETLGQTDPPSPTKRLTADRTKNQRLRRVAIVGCGILLLAVIGTATTLALLNSPKNKAGGPSPVARTSKRTPPAVRQVALESAYNRIGFTTEGVPFTSGGIDTKNTAFSANLLGSSITWNGLVFPLGRPDIANVVSASGQTIALTPGNWSRVTFLAVAVNTNQPGQTFSVAYRDGSAQNFVQSISDWNTPQDYPGESTVLTMPYRNDSTGIRDSKTFRVYGYSFPLDNTKQMQSVTLPNNTNVVVLASAVIGP